MEPLAEPFVQLVRLKKIKIFILAEKLELSTEQILPEDMIGLLDLPRKMAKNFLFLHYAFMENTVGWKQQNSLERLLKIISIQS